jgi:thiol-disulfide isomerase/thioredoxin
MQQDRRRSSVANFRPLISFLALSALLIAPIGCEQPQPPTGPAPAADTATSDADSATSMPDEAAPANRTSAAPPQSDNSATVSVTVGGADEFQKLLEKHRGKVVLVDFWATWCVPCVEQFPHSVELERKLRDQGFTVISVSMNEPEEKESVLEFLQKYDAVFDNLLGKYGAGSEFVDAFALRGDLPFYKLYDRQGQLRRQFSSEPEGIENCEPIDQIDARVGELLSEKPAE